MEIKKFNIAVAIILLAIAFMIGTCFSPPKYNFAPDEYFQEGDWVTMVELSGPDKEKRDRNVEESKAIFLTPNGSPKIGEKVRVIDVLNGGSGLVIENYPVYHNNNQTGWSSFLFKKEQ